MLSVASNVYCTDPQQWNLAQIHRRYCTTVMVYADHCSGSSISTARHEATMLQKFSIMLLSNAPKITYINIMLLRKCSLFSKLCHYF